MPVDFDDVLRQRQADAIITRIALVLDDVPDTDLVPVIQEMTASFSRSRPENVATLVLMMRKTPEFQRLRATYTQLYGVEDTVKDNGNGAATGVGMMAFASRLAESRVITGNDVRTIAKAVGVNVSATDAAKAAEFINATAVGGELGVSSLEIVLSLASGDIPGAKLKALDTITEIGLGLLAQASDDVDNATGAPAPTTPPPAPEAASPGTAPPDWMGRDQ